MKRLLTNISRTHLILVCFITGLFFYESKGHCGAAIIYPEAPVGGPRVVLKETGKILHVDPHCLGGFRLEELSVANPSRGYFVNPPDLQAGRLLSAARATDCWIYPLVHGGEAAGEMQLSVNERTGKAPRFNGLFGPDLAKKTQEALRTTQRWPQIKRQAYEVRRLNIASINFAAVWLHRQSDDILIPLPPTFERWKAYRPYSERQLIGLLQAEVKKTSAGDARLR